MIPVLHQKELHTSKEQKLFPNVFIKMAFEPLVMSKSVIENKMKGIFYNVESQAYKLFSADITRQILSKLSAACENLNYASQKKSVVISLSTGVERIYYLNRTLKEEVSVGKYFSIKDIFSDENIQKKYLLLVLTNESTRVFLGENDKLTLYVKNLPQQVAAYAGYGSQNKVTDSDFPQKFIKHAADVLHSLLISHPLPLIVIGTFSSRKLFSRVSPDAGRVAEYIETTANDIGEEAICVLMKPYLNNWRKIKGKHFIQEIELAAYRAKLVSGIQEVWKTARQSRSQMLVIEKNYYFPAYFGSNGPMPYIHDMVTKSSIQIKDAVDDVIENVLKDGGDIAFVEEGALDDYMHICLIKH